MKQHPVPQERADEAGMARCWYNGVPAIARPARTPGYYTVFLCEDPGYGNLTQFSVPGVMIDWNAYYGEE